MLKVGKWTKLWNKERAKLKEEFREKGITTCELRFKGCTPHAFLGFAHRHDRRWYRKHPEKLGDFDEVILACTNCHRKLDKKVNREDILRQKMFRRLRDEKEWDTDGFYY